MARVSFTAENRVASTNYEYPKLSLKMGERARIFVGLEAPMMEYVHVLRKPQIVNGVPTKIMKDRKDGSQYEDYAMDFVSRSICTGGEGILDEKGSDPKNCAICKLAKDSPDYAQAPQRRYAMHVIRYRTKSGTADVATPFSVELLVWTFTARIFNKLIDFAEEGFSLAEHDILLGPCTNQAFQQYDLSVSAKSEGRMDAERALLMKQTFESNQIPDLQIAIGNKKQEAWIQQDILTVLEAWGAVSASSSAADTTQSLDSGLSTLLDSPASQSEWLVAAPQTSAVEEKAANTDLLASIPGVAEEAPAEKKKSDAPAATNFDDILGNLGM